MKRYDLRMRNIDDGKSYYVLEKGNNQVDDNHDWYKEGDTYESVLFVEATPDSDYRKRVEAIVKKHDMKIKVVERVGQTVKSMLQRSNPFQGIDLTVWPTLSTTLIFMSCFFTMASTLFL
jgi:hypothetical protein